jgi:hypothetical protein
MSEGGAFAALTGSHLDPGLGGPLTRMVSDLVWRRHRLVEGFGGVTRSRLAPALETLQR